MMTELSRSERLVAEVQTEAAAPTYVQDLEREVERLQAELIEQKELVRKYALKAHEAEVDIERAKHRIEREAGKENEQRRRDFLIGFIDVLDNLQRALESARAVGDTAVVQGVELVRRNFVARLAEYGVVAFESLGHPFDPVRHEALSRIPVHSAEQDGVVIAVVHEGYLIGADTLRAASVAVGQYISPGPRF